MPFAATWKDLEIVIISEASQRKTNIICYHLYIWNLKYDTNVLIYETDSQTQRTDLWLTRGWGSEGGMDWKRGISRCNLLYTEWINNKVLLYSTGNYSQYPVINRKEKEYEKDSSGCTLMILQIRSYKRVSSSRNSWKRL